MDALLEEKILGSLALAYYEEMKKEFEALYETNKKNRKKIKDI